MLDSLSFSHCSVDVSVITDHGSGNCGAENLRNGLDVKAINQRPGSPVHSDSSRGIGNMDD